MKIACWNVRGMNSPKRQQDVRSIVQKNNIALIGLVETKVRRENSSSIMQNLMEGWQMLQNYQYHSGGRIWVLWNPKVLVISPLLVTDQILHVSATIIEKQVHFHVSNVYGHNTTGERLPLWNDIRSLSGTVP